jgi:hypothetical protein
MDQDATVIPGAAREIVIPAEAKRSAGTQRKISARDFWLTGLGSGLARDDMRGGG